MNTANRKRTEIDAELDRLEVEFEKNRKEMPVSYTHLTLPTNREV